MLGLFCPLTLFWASRKIGEESTGYDGLNMAVMQIISVFLAIAAVPLAIAALYIMAHLSAIQSTFSTNRLFWTVTLVYFAVASFVGVVAHHNLSEE